MTSDFILELDELRRVFPGFELGPLALTFERGHIYGLLGPNGAGKTTLINLVTLQLRPTSGAMRSAGTDIAWGDRRWKSRFCYIREEPAFYGGLTVAQTLSLASRLYDRWDAAVADRLRDLFALPPGRKVDKLSKGMRVKLGLAAALAHRADILILDEPTAGLDPTARADLQATVKQLHEDRPELCVILSSHIFEDIEETATDIRILRHGRLALGASAETLRSAVLYRTDTVGAVAQSPDLILRWSRRSTEWLLVRGDSPLDTELKHRDNHVDERPHDLLGAVYHGTAHVDLG